MTSIKVNDLPQLIMDRLGLVLYDDLLNLLDYRPERAPIVFKSLVRNTLLEYAKQYPVQLKSFINLRSNKVYKFVDNFDKYREYLEWLDKVKSDSSINSIPSDITLTDENKVMLKPIGIYFIKSGFMELNTQWWDYQPNSGELILKNQGGGRLYVEYFANYPYKMEIAKDNKFTEDSKIYYIGDHNIEVFLDFLAFYCIRQIRTLQGTVSLGNNIQFLANFDQLYAEFDQLVQIHRDQRSDILRMWRK